ncbi:Metal ion transporter [Globisporangium polare]
MAAINRKGYSAGEQISKRLNALGELQTSSCFGISRWFIVILLLTGGAWTISAMQTLVFAYLLQAIQHDLPMDTAQKAFVNGSVMIGAFLGSFVFGNFADMHGRKQMLLVSFALGTVGCALCAVSPNIEVLSLFRFIAGIGLGGEQPIMGSLILELSPERVRGRMLVYMDAFWAIGSILALVLAYELEPVIGWRYVLAINTLFLFYAVLIHLYIPESPKWLATVGRYEDAVKVMRAIEHSCSIFLDAEADDTILTRGNAAVPGLQRTITAGVDSVCTNADMGASQMIVHSPKQSFFKLLVDRFRILFRFPYFTRTMVLWAVCTGMSLTYYGVDIYFLDHLKDRVVGESGRSLVIYGAAVAQIPGYLLAARLVERLGRRNTLMAFLVGACIGSLVEAYVTSTTVALLLSSCWRSFFFMGAWGALYAYVPEHYPITIRVMGSAHAWGISRIGAFLGPYLVIWMSERWAFSTPQVVWSLCAVLFVVIIVLFFFGVETAGQQIDETERMRKSKGCAVGTPTLSVRESLQHYSILEDPYHRSLSAVV